MIQSNFYIIEIIRHISLQLSYNQRYKEIENDFKRIIYYNDDFNLNKKVEFISIYLFCNKLDI